MKHNIEIIEIRSLSMITKEHKQKIDIEYRSSVDKYVYFSVIVDGIKSSKTKKIPVQSGVRKISVFLEPVHCDTETEIVFSSQNGEVEARKKFIWMPPRKWTFYIMTSSHTDIGLHNSQYIQRYNSEIFLEDAIKLCDATEDRDDNDKYRYTIEGTWVWNNYVKDKGIEKAKEVVENYIKQGKIGLCCGIAGNLTQVFGLEEMCRSTYSKAEICSEWGLYIKTMAMIDNNGLSWGMVWPYAEAGIENMIFAPNQWNPILSTVWRMDTSIPMHPFNPQASGGGSRIDVRYDSALPMVFWWSDRQNKHRILVWAATGYHSGGVSFGIETENYPDQYTLCKMENGFSAQLPELERKYPYDVWLLPSYWDDEKPNMYITDSIKNWNEKWEWPKLRTLGDPDVPFERIKSKYADQIPILYGDITGGWYQAPVSTPELLSKKNATDRMLPTAEKLSVIASLINDDYLYPEDELNRAWECLLLNDEHSYGVSGYKGQRVYETWMQHRAWMDYADEVAKSVTRNALDSILSEVEISNDSVFVFNPASHARHFTLEIEGDRFLRIKLPPCGYSVIEKQRFNKGYVKEYDFKLPPEIENKFFIIKFSESGAIKSIYDKEQQRIINDSTSEYGVNEFLYTNDNHVSYHTLSKARFIIKEYAHKIVAVSTVYDELTGAEIIQTLILPHDDKYIDIDNRINHFKDMINKNRYYRYAYYAFPFDVKCPRRICHLNGTNAEYGKDITGHGTDVYMAVNEWCCVENNEHGVALLMPDSQLTEFDHIHSDKTDYKNIGAGSEIYCYLANDWLQMHSPGGSHMDFRFRYRIISYDKSYQSAGIVDAAEDFMYNPILAEAAPHKGKLVQKSLSFFYAEGQRILTIKKAKGKGIIVRLYGYEANITSDIFNNLCAERISVNEERFIEGGAGQGFATFLVMKESDLKCTDKPDDENCLKIGSRYTGLISKPCAACGECDGQLYLLWGQAAEDNISHYKLYRGENEDFAPDESSFVADVERGVYVVAGYCDTGLKTHTKYYYRVCAVDVDGNIGPFSEVFCGITKEPV